MLHELTVPAEAAGQRLDVWLEQTLPGCSRSLVARCIRQGLCRIEPGRTKPAYRLHGGEAVAIAVPEIEPLEAVPEDLPLRILHEDAALVAVDKAPGMVVHPAVGHPRGTLVNALLGRYGAIAGLVHRLDADTSGVIVAARSAAALAACQTAFKERRVTKRYLALLAGAPRSDVMRCSEPLGRHPRDFRRRAVLHADAGGAKAAETGFVVRERHQAYVAVEARPITGRTHQIRVHAAHLGHPVLADRVYGRHSRWPLDPAARPAIERQALHAWRLELPHPDGGGLVLQAPIPDDLRPWLAAELEPLRDPGAVN